MDETKNKITVKLKWELDEAKVHFVNIGIPLVESFILKDIYFITNDVDINKTTNSKILSQSIVIRENINDENEKELIYKNRNAEDIDKYDDYKMCSCPIIDVDKTCEFLNIIGLKECFRYEQECLKFSNKGNNIFLEYITDLGLFLKFENNKSIEELIIDLDNLNVPYYENDYFVKKDSLMLDLIKKKRR